MFILFSLQAQEVITITLFNAYENQATEQLSNFHADIQLWSRRQGFQF